MTKEEKDLLLKDLSARLPYGVKVGFKDSVLILKPSQYDIFTGQLLANQIYPESSLSTTYGYSIHNYHPYLRPMSSMTEEERGQYMEFIEWSHNDYDGTTTTCIIKEKLHEYIDFIYSHHFDDNGLIEKGLALEAPEGMYE